jgi:hypothetical protein
VAAALRHDCGERADVAVQAVKVRAAGYRAGEGLLVVVGQVVGVGEQCPADAVNSLSSSLNAMPTSASAAAASPEVGAYPEAADNLGDSLIRGADQRDRVAPELLGVPGRLARHRTPLSSWTLRSNSEGVRSHGGTSGRPACGLFTILQHWIALTDAVDAEGRRGGKVNVMKIKQSLAGAVLVLGMAAGGVAVAASIASAATTSAHNSPAGAPGIGKLGQTGTNPPAGVTVEKAKPATPAN